MLDAAVHRNQASVLRPLDQPRRSLLLPGVGPLDLMAVANFLTEEAVFIVDAVAIAGEVEGRERIQKTCGEAAETAVAEGGVRLVVEEQLQVEASLGEVVTADVDDAEIIKIVLERAA